MFQTTCFNMIIVCVDGGQFHEFGWTKHAWIMGTGGPILYHHVDPYAYYWTWEGI